MTITFGKLFKKVAKYAFGVFTGYEIHDQLVGPEKQLVPFVEKHIIEKETEDDETHILLYAVVAGIFLLVLIVVVIGATGCAMCKKATKNINKSLNN